MRIEDRPPFTWYFSDSGTEMTAAERREWFRRGGKWVVHDSLDHSRALAQRLAPFIDARQVHAAKLWHGDPTALLIYSLDTQREQVSRILDQVSAGSTRVWFYDTPLANLKSPLHAVRAIWLYFRTTRAGESHYRAP